MNTGRSKGSRHCPRRCALPQGIPLTDLARDESDVSETSIQALSSQAPSIPIISQTRVAHILDFADCELALIFQYCYDDVSSLSLPVKLGSVKYPNRVEKESQCHEPNSLAVTCKRLYAVFCAKVVCTLSCDAEGASMTLGTERLRHLLCRYPGTIIGILHAAGRARKCGKLREKGRDIKRSYGAKHSFWCAQR